MDNLRLALVLLVWLCIIKKVCLQFDKQDKQEDVDYNDNFPTFATPAGFCPSIKEGLTWPQTQAGEEVESLEYCFKSNGFRLNRSCIIDPSDNVTALWLPIFDKCQIPENGTLTKNLTFLDQGLNGNLNDLLFISSFYEEFSALDVYLAARVADRMIGGDLDLFPEIVDNVLKVDKKVLRESLVKMQATNLWLDVINKKFWYYDNRIVSGKNDDYISYYANSDNLLLIHQMKSNKTTITTGQWNMISSDKVESAIYRKLYYGSFQLMYFTTDVFFLEDDSKKIPDPKHTRYKFEPRSLLDMTKNISDIFGINEPNLNDPNFRYYFIHRFDERLNGAVTCARWNSTFWEIVENPEVLGSYFVCPCNYGYCTLISTNNEDIPKDLEDIFQFNITFEDVSKLNWVLTKSSKFSSTDVLHVETILKKIVNTSTSFETVTEVGEEWTNEDPKIRILTICKIISNVQNIPKSVLKKSSANLGHDIDNILENYLFTKEDAFLDDLTAEFVETNENFIIARFNKTKSLVLFKNKTIQLFQNLPKNDTIENIVSFSPTSENYVVVSIFLTNVLFSDNSNYTEISKIFKTYHDPNETNIAETKIFHKVKARSFDSACSQWINIPTTNGGFWKNQSQGNRQSSFVECVYTGPSISTLLVYENFEQILIELLNSNKSSDQMMETLAQISSNYDNLSSSDIALIGEVLKKVSSDESNSLENLAKVVNNLQEVDKRVLQENQSVSDSILYYTDLIIQNYNTDSPTFTVFTKNFDVFIFNLNKTNLLGFALTGKEIEEISDGDKVDNFLNRVDVTSVIILNSSLTKQILEGEETKVIINTYFQDVLFNDKNTKSRKVSTIFDVILPKNLGNYSGPISVFHKSEESSLQKKCSYWKYNVPKGIPGVWKFDDDSHNLSSFTRCDFWHTTHFALLLFQEDKYKNRILDIITASGAILSFIGYICTISIILFFKNLREKIENKILLNFLFCGLLLIVAFYISNYIADNFQNICLYFGPILHYLVLVQMAWMMVIAVMQYRRLIKVLGNYNNHILLKTCLPAWGIPLVPVIIVLTTNYGSYRKNNSGLCYPSGNGLHFGVWLPVAFVLVFNLIVFVTIIYSIKKAKASSSLRRFSGNGALYHKRQFLFLFFVLGLTWIFGFFGEVNLMFTIIFDLMATLLGFVMFVFFIISNYKHFLLKKYFVSSPQKE